MAKKKRVKKAAKCLIPDKVVEAYRDARKAAPDDDCDGENHGLTTGLRITNFVNELLIHNRKQKLGDDDLQQALADEFPKRETIQPLTAYRSEFNAKSKSLGDGGLCVQYQKLSSRKNVKVAKKKTANRKVTKKPTKKPTKKKK